MVDTLEYYVKLFSKLRTDRARWKGAEVTKEQAPHKPLLLLSVIEQFKQGTINVNLIELTPDLSESFRLYWYRIMPPDSNGNIVMPFFHLKSDGFWQLKPYEGKREILASKRAVRSITEINELAVGAELDTELFELLQSEQSREVLRTTLLNIFFSETARRALIEQEYINVEAYRYSQNLLKKLDQEDKEKAEQSEPIRKQGFRRAIITAYEHRCAMSGIRILTPDGHTAVNAAHIVPWSVSHNDDPSNGLALSPLCHWAFDEGLLSVDVNYRIILSPHLRRDDNIAGDLLALERRELILPRDENFRPDLEAIEYHRKKILYR